MIGPKPQNPLTPNPYPRKQEIDQTTCDIINAFNYNKIHCETSRAVLVNIRVVLGNYRLGCQIY